MPHSRTPLKNKRISIALGAIASCLLFLLLHTVSKLEKNQYLYKERQEAINYGETLGAAVNRELNSLLFISNGLSSYLTVYKDELKSDKINAILQDLWNKAKFVKNLGVAIGYRLTWVYPLKGNESIVGVDFRDVPLQWNKVKLAVDTRQGIMDGPINLIQGGSGIVYRYPIFIEDKYWGIISTVINTQPFLEEAFHGRKNNDYVFAIRTDSKRVFYGDPDLFNHQRAVLIESNLPNGKWEWAVEKRDLAYPKYFYGLDLFNVVLALLAGVGFYYYIHERYILSREALIDSLTNLPNRRYLDKQLLQAAYDAEKNSELFCVMLIDIDHFKSINDTYGHTFGDASLVTVAKTIQSKIRATDTLGRMGGDEFVLLLRHLKSPEDAEAIVIKIMEAFKEFHPIFDVPTKLSLSIGLAVSPMNGKVNIRHVMNQADEALYLAKGEGRDRYKIYSK